MSTAPLQTCECKNYAREKSKVTNKITLAILLPWDYLALGTTTAPGHSLLVADGGI